VALDGIPYEPLTSLCSADQRARLDAFGDLLLQEAMPAGYIGDCSRSELDLSHILDSILPAIAPESKETFPLWRNEPLQIFDLGAGAGLPSLPLAILFPQHTFHLLDAQEKRCRFAVEAAQKVGLTNVKVYHGVIQDFPEKHGKDIKADVVIFRAFRKILASLELALHILRPAGGPKVLYWRSQSVPFSETGFKRVVDLGYNIDSFVKFVSAETILPRGLYTFTKNHPTAKGYPRSWKKISADKLVETES
jgi:16S rRNA (guanine527-N7)-methyltransferase